ncbi:hypothetical protein [Campylobacter sp. RM16188]|uniref:beta family protein n=1 Tax=Campylobacter sp. RM16188 TaxID=1705725 RepID=UPI0015579552|nr:hypothetical protein [Campylobacter sp. RM16188]
MYYPIIKNKLNEIKGLKQALTKPIEVNPIIELVNAKTQDIDDFLDTLLSGKANGMLDIFQQKKCFVDIPTYFSNQFIGDLNLIDYQAKYNFFIKLSEKAKEANLKDIVPVISFEYSLRTRRESIRQNRIFARKIIEAFDDFAIRLFQSDLFKQEDLDIFWELYDFLPDGIEKATVIMDVSNSNMDYVINNIEEITKQCNVKKIILAGESLKDSQKADTEFSFARLKNIHLSNFNVINNKFSGIALGYADFTITDKIQSSIDIDGDKGFLYYPFIKYATEDGNLCTFTANNRGNYEQYKELCQKIVNEIRNFSTLHCETCAFIKDVVSDKIESFKSGNIWKHRMIAHYIVTMSNLINNDD